MAEKLDLILVPTDFSQYSCEAFGWAALFARKLGAKILVLHVISEKDSEEMVSRPGNPWEKVLEEEDKEMIEDFKICANADFDPTILKETQVAVGVAHTQIVEMAKEKNVSMIVIGTHGRTGLSHVLMGSVAEQVVRLASCPVLTVKPKNLRK